MSGLRETIPSQLTGAQERDRPEGPVSAAIIAGGVGSFALGLLTTIAEGSESFKENLQLNDEVGPLSGKTTYAVAIWLASWFVLHLTMRRGSTETRTALTIALVLVGLGVVGTFPTFFQAFAAE